MKRLLQIFPFFPLWCIAQDIPTPRSSAHLIYYKPARSLVLIDGYEKGTFPLSGKAETWAWKNNAWSRLDATDQPLRSLSGAVYTGDNKIFLYGGVGSRGYDDTLKDAYNYDGQKWNKLNSPSIGTRDHHEMAYDEHNKTIVLYGGQNAKREFDTKTWIYKNDQWSVLDIPGPGPRVHHTMSYDTERKKIVLFGGSTDKSTSDETWEFDGISWSKIAVAANPGARSHHSMVYDPSRKKVLLYGGNMDMKAKGDIWSWDGTKWEMLSDNGPGRFLAAAAFNSSNNKLYVFGGNGGEQGMLIYSDLWEWDGGKWSQVHTGKMYKWDMSQDKFVIAQ
jgi:hypothetical protein